MFRKNLKIEIKPSIWDKRIILLGWGFVVLNFLLVLISCFDLPDAVPIHFNVRGEPDGFGSKSDIWAIPLINVAMYLGLYWVLRKIKPWKFNYPVKVTETNAPKLYRMGIRMLVWLNLSLAIVFFVLSLYTILLTKSIKLFPNGWTFIMFVCILPILPIFYFTLKMLMPKTSKE